MPSPCHVGQELNASGPTPAAPATMRPGRWSSPAGRPLRRSDTSCSPRDHCAAAQRRHGAPQSARSRPVRAVLPLPIHCIGNGGGQLAAQTVGFAVAEHDRPVLDRLVERYGCGNRSEFLRVAMRVMAAEERAERLRDLQVRAHAQVGRVYTPNEVNDLVTQVLRSRG